MYVTINRIYKTSTPTLVCKEAVFTIFMMVFGRSSPGGETHGLSNRGQSRYSGSFTACKLCILDLKVDVLQATRIRFWSFFFCHVTYMTAVFQKPWFVRNELLLTRATLHRQLSSQPDKDFSTYLYPMNNFFISRQMSEILIQII